MDSDGFIDVGILCPVREQSQLTGIPQPRLHAVEDADDSDFPDTSGFDDGQASYTPLRSHVHDIVVNVSSATGPSTLSALLADVQGQILEAMQEGCGYDREVDALVEGLGGPGEGKGAEKGTGPEGSLSHSLQSEGLPDLAGLLNVSGLGLETSYPAYPRAPTTGTTASASNAGKAGEAAQAATARERLLLQARVALSGSAVDGLPGETAAMSHLFEAEGLGLATDVGQGVVEGGTGDEEQQEAQQQQQEEVDGSTLLAGKSVQEIEAALQAELEAHITAVLGNLDPPSVGMLTSAAGGSQAQISAGNGSPINTQGVGRVLAPAPGRGGALSPDSFLPNPPSLEAALAQALSASGEAARARAELPNGEGLRDGVQAALELVRRAMQ